jgi:hypothetical protein
MDIEPEIDEKLDPIKKKLIPIEEQLNPFIPLLEKMGRDIDHSFKAVKLEFFREALANAGSIIEDILKDVWGRENISGNPKKKNIEQLFSVIKNKIDLDRLVDDYISDIQKVRNRAAHGEEVLLEDCLETLRKLPTILKWYKENYLEKTRIDDTFLCPNCEKKIQREMEVCPFCNADLKEAEFNYINFEHSLIARYWYLTGIEKLFIEDEYGKSFQGMDFSEKFVEEILCAAVEEIQYLETFHFDRAFIFSRSGFRAIDKDPRIMNRATSPMKLTVLEAAVESKRPQDHERFLSVMERMVKKGEQSEQPSREMYFDVTKKKIGYKTDCVIDAKGKWNLKTVDNRRNKGLEPIIIRLDEESGDLKEDKDKIEAVMKTLFVGFTGKDDGELQVYCQQTYQFYDADGLCFICDFPVKVKDIPALKKIQDAYFDVFFEREMADWERLWSDTPQNIPDLEAFKRWQEQRESKVVLVSFDPYQNLGNMDRYGKRYLGENDAFTIILVADEDNGKNILDLQTEILDLRQMFLMVVRRKLREARMQKEIIRGQNKLFTTMMSSIMHRFKSYTSHQEEREEIDNMRQRFERGLTMEDYSAAWREFHSIRDVSEYFLSPFINEQLWKKLSKIADKRLEDKFETACKEYLGKLIFLKKTENIDDKELEIIFNKNYLPQIKVKLRDEFIKDAVMILIDNALEHAAIYGQKTQNKAEIIISFHLCPQLENDLCSLEFSIINSSLPIHPERLKMLNSPDPGQSKKDTRKAASIGIGIFIARTLLQRSIGKGADIRLDNVGENYVEAKLILPATKTFSPDDNLEEI